MTPGRVASKQRRTPAAGTSRLRGAPLLLALFAAIRSLAAFEFEELAEDVAFADADFAEATFGEDAHGGDVPGRGGGADGADFGVGEGPLDGGADGFGGVAAALGFFFDAVGDLDDTFVVGAAVEDDAADDAVGLFAGDHHAVAPEADIGVGADALERGPEGALDEGAAGPEDRHAGVHEALDLVAATGEDFLHERHRDRQEGQPRGEERGVRHTLFLHPWM